MAGGVPAEVAVPARASLCVIVMEASTIATRADYMFAGTAQYSQGRIAGAFFNEVCPRTAKDRQPKRSLYSRSHAMRTKEQDQVEKRREIPTSTLT